MSRALPLLAACVLVSVSQPSSAGAAGEPAGRVRDLVFAVVRYPGSAEGTLITLSRLEDETRILLVHRGSVSEADRPLEKAALEEGLQWLVDQTLIDGEAARLRVFEIDLAEARAELERFRARFARPRDYELFRRRWSLEEPEVVSVLGRMARVKRYLDSRVSHAAQVPEAEVTAWLEGHAAELGTRDRDAARLILARGRVDEETSALVGELRARADVRRLGDLEGLPDASGGRQPGPAEVTR